MRLARMARRGWLRTSAPRGSKEARVYHLTPRGREVLARVRHVLDELYGEVREVPAARRPSPH